MCPGSGAGLGDFFGLQQRRRMWLEASFNTAATDFALAWSSIIKLQGFELGLKSDMGTFSLSL
jgi:hypothetical protein